MDTQFLHKRLFFWCTGMAFSMLFLAGCQKERDVFVPFGKTTDALRELLTSFVTDPAHTTTLEFDGSNKQVLLTTPRGIQISITDATDFFADENGQPVNASSSKKITLTATDVFEKKEMTGLGTVSQADFGDALETVGLVKFEAFLDGKALKLVAGKEFEVHIPVGSAGYRIDVHSYNGGWSNSATESKFRWSLLEDFPAPSIQLVPDGITYYQMSVDKMGWLAGNRVLPNATAPIYVKLDNAFSLTNTLAFFVLKGKKSVFPLKFDLNSNVFLNENVPVGESGMLFCASKIGDQLYLGTKDVVIENNQPLDVAVLMNGTNEAALKLALEDLK